MVLPHRCVWRVNPADAALCTNSGSKEGERERLGAAQDTVKDDYIGIKCSAVSLWLIYTLHTKKWCCLFFYFPTQFLSCKMKQQILQCQSHTLPGSPFRKKSLITCTYTAEENEKTWTDRWDNLFSICPYLRGSRMKEAKAGVSFTVVHII